MKPIIAIIALCFFTACTSAPHAVRSARRVIVPATTFAPQATPTWSPTEAQFAKCEAAIGAEVAKKKRSLADYYVRMSAIVRNGRPTMVGDACHKEATGAERYIAPARPDTILLSAYGGGEAFFSFEYDTTTDAFLTFQFNAPL